jgi:hypothetical protein
MIMPPLFKRLLQNYRKTEQVKHKHIDANATKNVADRPDHIGLYDALLGAVGPKAGHPHFRGGYKIWPSSEELINTQYTIMCIGNSTSLWPNAAWSLELGKLLKANGIAVAIYNGAGKGNTSSQEVLRILRDVPGIKPDMILNLSGICDIGYLLNAKSYPYSHKYVRRALSHLKDSGHVTDTVFGYPDHSTPAEVWCRNQRMSAAIAHMHNVPMLTFLQAVQGFGKYPETDEEKAFFQTKAGVILQSAGKTYHECVVEFYNQVRSIISTSPELYPNVIDFTDVFNDCPGAYRDHRHQSTKGVKHLAEKILPLVLQKFKNNIKTTSI